MNLKTVLQGIAMGVAELIPGLNAATLALVLGIYEKFIDLLFQFSRLIKTGFSVIILRRGKWSQVKTVARAIPWRFGISLFVGTLIAIIGLSQLLHTLLDIVPQYVYGFFFGLILASLSVPWASIHKKESIHYILLIVSSIIFFGVFSLTPTELITSPSYVYIFIGGVLGVASMLLGSGGSTVLVAMGLYQYILGLVGDIVKLDFTALLPLIIFFSGLGVGFLLSISLIKKALASYHSIIMAIITGILLASLRAMWPFFEVNDKSYILQTPWDSEYILGIGISILIGIGVIAIFKKYSDKV
jgi:putative membrane protein